MKVAHTIAELRTARAEAGADVALVPTMGALHHGHRALFRAARNASDVVVASIFVNPAQFSSAADLEAYPRNLEQDFAVARDEGVDLVFAPASGELYPEGFATWVAPEGAADGFEGELRPGHFKGVATVCVKLFNLVRPRTAWFGRKDAQQVAVMKQVVRDLNLDIEIRAIETVRDADGLALSSRNALLSPAERERALALPRALATRDPKQARALLAEAGVDPDYVAVADFDGPTLAAAVRVGGVRLIDNVRLEGASS